MKQTMSAQLVPFSSKYRYRETGADLICETGVKAFLGGGRPPGIVLVDVSDQMFDGAVHLTRREGHSCTYVRMEPVILPVESDCFPGLVSVYTYLYRLVAGFPGGLYVRVRRAAS